MSRAKENRRMKMSRAKELLEKLLDDPTVQKLDKPPKGWTKVIDATTAPNGYVWYSNGESRFSNKRKIVLVKMKG